MSETPIFGFRLVGENTTEAGKAASANENALIAEALFKQRVESRSIADPPGSPSNADVYIVPASDTSPAPSGAWAGHEDEIAIYYNGWLFVAPINGPVFYVVDEDLSVKYDTTASPPAWVVGGASTFIGQSDTPASYSGEAGKVTKVNSGETGLEFVEAGGGAWTKITSHDFAANPAIELVVTGIDAYTDIVIIAVGLDAATITPVRLFLSTDGGSTFLTTSGDYQNMAVSDAGATVQGDDDNAFQFNGSAISNNGHGRCLLQGMALSTMHTSWHGHSANGGGSHYHGAGWASTPAIHDALRLRHNNDTNLTAGSVHVYGR